MSNWEMKKHYEKRIAVERNSCRKVMKNVRMKRKCTVQKCGESRSQSYSEVVKISDDKEIKNSRINLENKNDGKNCIFAKSTLVRIVNG